MNKQIIPCEINEIIELFKLIMYYLKRSVGQSLFVKVKIMNC